MKLLNMIAAGALFINVGVVSAAENEPLTLTELQMDNVTAAGTAVAYAFGDAFGAIFANSFTYATTGVEVLQIIPVQAGQITVDYTFSYSYSEASAL